MDLKEKIEAAIRETLVIENTQSIQLAVDRILNVTSKGTGHLIETIDRLQSEKDSCVRVNAQLRDHCKLVPGQSVLGFIQDLEKEKNDIVIQLSKNANEINRIWNERENQRQTIEKYHNWLHKHFNTTDFDQIERDFNFNKNVDSGITFDQTLEE